MAHGSGAGCRCTLNEPPPRAPHIPERPGGLHAPLSGVLSSTRVSTVKNAAGDLLDRIRDRTAVVTIVGLGYVGCPTAVAFAEQGFKVIGADLSEEKIHRIREGRPPIHEPGLEERLQRVVKNGLLEATTDVDAACAQGDCVLLIVPTPVDAMRQPDLSYVRGASRTAAGNLRRGQLVVLESTTYPGTSEEIVLAELNRNKDGLRAGPDYGVAYCPERYNPGDTEHNLSNLVRVVGAIDDDWADCAAALYGTLNGDQIARVRDLKTAEAVKVIENVQRDLNIALVNELARIFERLGIDTHEVLDAAATKWNFIKYTPGPGVGGHCLPVDPYYLTSIAERVGYHPRVILAGRATNDAMPKHVADLVMDGLNEVERAVKGSKVAVLGLAYKAGSGDARESPARRLVQLLDARGAQLALVDPLVEDDAVQEVFGHPSTPLDDALQGAHAVVVVTDHDEIRRLQVARIKELADASCLVVDTRNLLDPEEVTQAGLRYKGVGRFWRS